jgi:hypothetical protein
LIQGEGVMPRETWLQSRLSAVVSAVGLGLCLCALTPGLLAQARGGGFAPGFSGGGPAGGFTPGFAGGHGGGPVRGGIGRPERGIVGGFRHHHNGSRPGVVFIGSPFWYEDGWYDSRTDIEQPDTKVVEAPAKAAAEPPTPPSQPLMIERQDNRFVRMSDAEANAAAADTQRERAMDSRKNGTPAQPSGSEARGHAAETPAVLVFRDGRRQEVESYSIIGGALYESASYYSSGYWTRKIQLAELDLPATVKLNRERGVNFVLPGGPNQIVTRP